MEEYDYFFDVREEDNVSNKVFVLIIYDISNNKIRTRFAKLLQGYGFRVQKSAFEAILTKKKYDKLIREIPGDVETEDSVKVYKIIGQGQVKTFGKIENMQQEEVIII